MDAAVIAAYELCVFTGPGFTRDYLQPLADKRLEVEDGHIFQPQEASLKELSELPVAQQLATDQELGTGRAERPQQRVWEFCLECRVEKRWYSHHCFICNKCVIRMDHHCRSRP